MRKMDAESFSVPLLRWYDENKREMIWRDHPDPYFVWLSEIMLQQTRIEAAKEYFVRFTSELPDIPSLASVSEERLMKLWEGLGYYNRARNLKKTAEILVEEYDGKLPEEFDQLLSLPGIGPYTAGAIASMAFGVRVPAVDGNVLRVVMRYLQCAEDISRQSVRKKVEKMIGEVMPERPGDFNQAVMELGEVVCIPNGAPFCDRCPLNGTCLAKASGCQEEYPKKAPKKPRCIEDRTIYVLEYEGRIGIRKRPQKGLLGGLYEFPAKESFQTLSDIKREWKGRGAGGSVISLLGEAKHIFSHVEWHMRGYQILLGKEPSEAGVPDDIFFVTREELRQNYVLPTAFHFFLEKIL